ncbi:MAG: hypothetical protein ACFFAU_18810, partial [Candidatus Hodarchaeota archaeon]
LLSKNNLETQRLVAYQRKSWKRFIDIVLTKTPIFIEKYPLKSQTILKDFFNTIKYHEEAAFDRKSLSNRFRAFNAKYYRKNDYIKTAFLWFAIEYLKNANRLLTIAEFHADDFYHYLTTFLRGNTNTTGIFQLISKVTPLNDLKWEELQYSCTKLQFSLSSEQIYFLKSLYSLVSEPEVTLYDPRRLKYSIESLMKTSSISRKLPALLTEVEDRWNYWLFPAAFGLSTVYIEFQLKKSVSLEEIIDYRNPENTTLTNSRIYQIRNSPRKYTGLIVIPSLSIDFLIKYLNTSDQNGKMTILELETIIDIHYSASLNLYQNERGWGNLSKTELGRLAQKLKTEQPRKGRIKLPFFFLTKQCSKNWSYLQYSDPPRMIELFCKSYPNFSFKDLTSNSLLSFDKADVELLKTLHQNNVIQLNLMYTRLILEYSIDQYLIKIPVMDLRQLSRLLAFIPWSELFLTSKNILIMAFLPNYFSQWMKEDLNWSVKVISEANIPISPKISWFNPEINQWYIPHLLKKLAK